jgi:hypothetical protein
MKFKDLTAPTRAECWGMLDTHDAPLVPGAVELRRGKRPGTITLAQGGTIASFTFQESGEGSRLEQHLYSGVAHLASVTMVKDRSLQLSVRFYHGGPLQFASIDVAFDDAAVNAGTRHGVRGTRSDEILRNLEERMVYQADREELPYFFVQPTPDRQGGSEDGLERGFTMLGNGYQLEVAVRHHPEQGPVFVARRLMPARTAKSAGLRLASGQVRFLDHTKLGQLRPMAQAAMSRLTQGVGSYFRAWDEYGSLEGAMLLQRARTVGILKPLNVEPGRQGTRFFIEGGIPENVANAIDVLDIVRAAPSYLLDLSIDWDTYCDEVAQGSGEDDARVATAKVLHSDAHSLTLDVRFEAALKDSVLVLSMRGDLKQITRRMRARQLILEGRSANPLLGLIIEKDGDLPRADRPPRIEPLSPNVLRKVFRKAPTERQQLAIELALNTPDIMVIQGPPGTGKTTVITAIIERLNELRDKRGTGKGEVLVTAHQHDAVDNVIRKLRIDGRPAVKFGIKSGDDDGASERMGSWTDELAARVRAAHPAIRESELQRQLSQQASAYMDAPSLAQGAALLRHIALLPPQLLDAELAERNRDLLQDITTQMSANGQQAGQAVRALHALRTTAAGFADDGPSSAGVVELHCGEALSGTDRALLERAMGWSDTAPPPFLDALAELKACLLARYCKPPPFRFDKPRNDLLSHLAAVSRAVERHELAGGDPVAAILADFVHELEGNPAGVTEALGDYSFVFAATCQGAERGEIRRAKRVRRGIAPADAAIEYDTVIIDEAARVSPRDLLIPMAQGLRRIILVGDHRQLPHIVEEEIIRQLEAGEGDTAVLQQSAFQYLRERAIEMERRDGIARTVTLDRQYRMHSFLGEFVSRQFYDEHKEGFGSPEDDTPYLHQLAGTGGRPLAWLNVPHSAGPDARRPPSSWYREIEAQKIVEQLDAWIGTEEGCKLSFGIITFYRAQVDEIYKALERKNYAVRTPSGEWAIAPAYREKIGDMERLRVGTVDAFQGMEFDVVFLSIVRSPSPARGGSAKRSAAGVFGRLQTESLQCVGMSRQKRLLVVAGDAALLDHELAEQAVPALHALRRLCTTEGACL